MHHVLPIFLLILLLPFLLFPFCHTGPFPFVPAVLTRSLCVCLCVLPCMARSPWAVSSSLAHYLQTPTQMRAAATCWLSWTIRCPLLHSRVPPTPQHQCLDQCLTTWMVRAHLEEHSIQYYVLIKSLNFTIHYNILSCRSIYIYNTRFFLIDWLIDRLIIYFEHPSSIMSFCSCFPSQ